MGFNLHSSSLNHAITFHKHPSISSLPHNHSVNNRQLSTVSARATTAQSSSTTADQRRSANYKPTTWSYEFLQSIKVKSNVQRHGCDVREGSQHVLKSYVMEEDSLLILELIDDIQRLGLAHRFESGIKKALDNLAFIIDGCNTMSSNMSLHEVALCFRLLRQNGYFVSHDVFKDLVSDKNNEALLKGCGHEDVRDMLSLYDASYLAYQGEDILDKAREHATERLNTFLMEISSSNGDENMEELVRHSLEVPLHRRMVMLEARWYIEAYKKKEGANMALLELAKLEFNMAQSVLQGDLKVSSRWWNNLGLAKELSFSRDRLVESFFWTVGMMFEPRFSSCRKDLTQVTSFITIIDDIYDVYGTMDELELFTDAVERYFLIISFQTWGFHLCNVLFNCCTRLTVES
ncbi:unnamed protein product [Linum tenue]|uniref:Uncharacterized protein n=1 Tax=Linum tenue TaxID=586396 RepID=A0AAV0QZ54_9ROSI|nr:unnamed protein product [Linum tenue]